MGRRIWIVKKKKTITQTDVNNAKLNGCPEIANGIPPALAGKISESDLPCAYEEPEPPPPEPIRDLAAEVDQLKAEVESLKAKVKIV